jgi:ribonuclease HI
MAIKRAIEVSPIDRDVLIWSDSNYAIKCVTEWFPTWIEKKWKNSAGKDVMNKDIIEPIIDRIAERRLAGASTKFNWVKGHENNLGNVAADALATNGAREAKTQL